MPLQILIAKKIEKEEHSKVYSPYLVWSHLWWAIGYPIVGYTGTHFTKNRFFIAVISTILFLRVTLFFYPRQRQEYPSR
jgi:MFS transporter, NRE family, putaive nickel resistance protein